MPDSQMNHSFDLIGQTGLQKALRSFLGRIIRLLKGTSGHNAIFNNQFKQKGTNAGHFASIIVSVGLIA